MGASNLRDELLKFAASEARKSGGNTRRGFSSRQLDAHLIAEDAPLSLFHPAVLFGEKELCYGRYPGKIPKAEAVSSLLTFE